MSKKMLKRSLALGALMAFVITGSAWAEEEIYIGANSNIPVFDKNDTNGVDLTNYVVNSDSVTTGEAESRIYGINVDKGNCEIVLKDDSVVTIDAGSEQARAIRVNGNGTSFTATKSLELNATTDAGKFAVGYAAYNNNLTVLNDINIVADNINTDNKGCNVNTKEAWLSARAIGIDIENSRNDNVVNGKAFITAKGNAFTQGIYMYQANLTFKDYAEIAAQSTRVSGYEYDVKTINAEDYASGVGSSLTFEKDVVIKAMATQGRAIAIFASGNDDLGIDFKGEDTKIIVESELSSMGMYVTGQADVMSEGKVSIEATTKNGKAYGVVSAQYNDAEDGSKTAGNIELTGETKIIARSLSGDEAVAIWAKPSDSPAANIIVGGNDKKVEIIGDVKAQGGSITTTLGTSDSKLTGAVTTVDGATTTLNMVEGATWDASKTGKNTLTNLTGKGTLVVGAEDTVNVVNTLSENITVAASVALAEKFAEDGEVTEDEVATLKDNLTNGNKDVVATYQVGETALTGVTTLSADGKYVSNVNTSNLGIRDMAGLALVAWRAENNDMNKRLGELRNAEGEHGVWVRMVRGESEYSTVKNQYNTYQLGYDEKLSVDPSWTVGMALSYTDGESSFAKGSGENNSKGVAVYGSKLNSDGSFVDLIAKYARIENEFDVLGGVGGAEYETNGYSVSAEYGKRYAQSNGMWIEPQVELTYGKVSAVDYVTKNSYKVSQDGMESLVGRVGFSLGKDVKGGNVYARASYLYDFDGETELTFADKVKMDQDLGGGWWEVGVGANINLSKATYIYADVEKTFGGEVDTNWQWNLGVRYSF